MFGLSERKKVSDFEELALPHLDTLYHTARRLTKSEYGAEDLVQETYLKAFRFFHSFEKGTYIKAWLFKIMTNTFINQCRKKQRDRELIEEWSGDIHSKQPKTSRDTEEEILGKFVSKEVLAALEEIPVDFRMVVIYADLEDFSYKEIAEMLNCPIGTVMSRLYRGRRMLRKLLLEYATEQGYISAEKLGEEALEKLPENVTQISKFRNKDHLIQKPVNG